MTGAAANAQADGAADAEASAARLDAWRARGAAAADPVGAAVIEALARRAAAQQGMARALLQHRLAALLADHGAKSTAAAAAASAPAARRAARTGLSELVDRLGRTAARDTEHAAPPAPLKAVAAFQGTWSRLRAEQRLRQALAQVPAQAGPLNTAHLVHRALQAMQALSPAYLDAFMAQVDTLLWLEQASGGGDLSPRAPARPDARRRPGARPPRQA